MEKMEIIAVVVIAILLMQTPIYANMAKSAAGTLNVKHQQIETGMA